MATGRVRKASLICPDNLAGALLEGVQSWGKMEFISIGEGSPSDPDTGNWEKISFILDTVESYAPPEPAFRKLRDGVPRVSISRAREIEEQVDIASDYGKLRKLDLDIKQAQSAISESEREAQLFKGLAEIPVSSSDTEFDTLYAEIGVFENVSAGELGEGVYVFPVAGPHKAVFYFRDSAGDTRRALEEAGFRRTGLPEDKTPEEAVKSAEKRVSRLKEKMSSCREAIRKDFLPNLFEYRVLGDIYENRIEREREALKGSETAYFKVLEGWIPRESEKELVELLEENFPAAYAEFSAPGKDETPPVILKNRGVFRPFETVTTLYGTPGYGQVDPTPYTAPFFILFFGLCLSDAGYGVVMMLVSLLALKKLKLREGAKKFLRMLVWGGGMSVLVGALMGSWFGNAARGSFLDRFMVYDALENPEQFLYFSVGLGFIHVLLGVIISAGKNILERDYREAFFSDIPWVGVLVFGGVFGVARIMGADAPARFSGYLVSAAAAAVVLFSGYRSSGIAARIGSGLYNLYGGIDYLKDMLSYSRLFALGMATAILAMAVNEIAGFLTSGFGYVLIPFVLLGGHLVLNLFMSSLSAYVHTSRLQYVEFFTKFFKGGGRLFTPLSWRSRRVELAVTE